MFILKFITERKVFKNKSFPTLLPLPKFEINLNSNKTSLINFDFFHKFLLNSVKPAEISECVVQIPKIKRYFYIFMVYLQKNTSRNIHFLLVEYVAYGFPNGITSLDFHHFSIGYNSLKL